MNTQQRIIVNTIVTLIILGLGGLSYCNKQKHEKKTAQLQETISLKDAQISSLLSEQDSLSLLAENLKISVSNTKKINEDLSKQLGRKAKIKYLTKVVTNTVIDSSGLTQLEWSLDSVNQENRQLIAQYNNLISRLKELNIQPVRTLSHEDDYINLYVVSTPDSTLFELTTTDTVDLAYTYTKNGLFKPATYSVFGRTTSPYSTVSSPTSLIFTERPRRFGLSTYLGYGVTYGQNFNTSVWDFSHGPQFGIGLNYQFLKF